MPDHQDSQGRRQARIMRTPVGEPRKRSVFPLSRRVRLLASRNPAGAQVVEWRRESEDGATRRQYMKKALAVLATVFALAGCDRQNALIENEKDNTQSTLNDRKEAVDNAVDTAKKQAEADAKTEKANLEAAQEKAHAQIEADKKKAEAEAKAEKAENNAQQDVK
jgi:hypothetical protein